MSPERKKSSSRHRSPTTSRRSSSPADAQKMSSSSSRKSSYDNKSKSSDSKHSKEKNSDSHSSSSSKSSPSSKSRNRSSRSKSPSTVVIKATDPITKDIDLRAQLQPPLSLTNSLINSTIIDNDLIACSTVTASVPLASSSIADRNMNINSDIRDQSKNLALKILMFFFCCCCYCCFHSIDLVRVEDFPFTSVNDLLLESAFLSGKSMKKKMKENILKISNPLELGKLLLENLKNKNLC